MEHVRKLVLSTNATVDLTAIGSSQVPLGGSQLLYTRQIGISVFDSDSNERGIGQLVYQVHTLDLFLSVLGIILVNGN